LPSEITLTYISPPGGDLLIKTELVIDNLFDQTRSFIHQFTINKYFAFQEYSPHE